MTITAQKDDAPFQILSLDGGGIRGIFSAGVLARLEENLDGPISRHFDLITGTSTGGIIALGLGLGLSPREIVQFYRSKGDKIFPGGYRKPFRAIRHLAASKFGSQNLSACLQEVFGDRLLGHSSKRLVIPSFDLGNGTVRVFKTPHHPDLKSDYKCAAWKVAMATTAAPTYLPAFRGIDERRLIDGGVWANNPSVVGIVEAISKLNIQPERIRLLSLGTTSAVTYPPKSLNKGGKVPWAKWAPEVIMKGQSEGAIGQASLILGKERFYRIDSKVPDGLFSLDYANHQELMAAARHEAMQAEAQVQDLFCAHQAQEFIPLHKPN